MNRSAYALLFTATEAVSFMDLVSSPLSSVMTNGATL